MEIPTDARERLEFIKEKASIEEMTSKWIDRLVAAGLLSVFAVFVELRCSVVGINPVALTIISGVTLTALFTFVFYYHRRTTREWEEILKNLTSSDAEPIND